MGFLQTLQPISLSSVLLTVALLFIYGAASLALYRLYFHPLSRFPGPRVAAATMWYRTYYDLWLNGKMTHNIAKLHKIYGPIVRIGPNELHFSDPAAYSTIYNNTSKFLKEPAQYNAFTTPLSSLSYLDPHAARGRREMLSPLFSKRAITNMQNLIAGGFDTLSEKLAEYSDTGEAADLYFAFRCTTAEIITKFLFNHSLSTLAMKGFRSPIVLAIQVSTGLTPWFKHFPLTILLVSSSPEWLTKLLSPAVGQFVALRKILNQQIDDFIKNPSGLEKTPHPIIYNRLLDPNSKGASAAPATQKSLQDEAVTLLIAGSDTVGHALMIGVFSILDSPEVLQKLVVELKGAWPDLDTVPTYEELEKLPYLTAIIKETLRMSNGVVSPLPRVVPAGGATISGEFVPAKTTVMMSAPIVHANEDIFPDSQNFIPERWQQPDSKHLETFLVSFSKGTRLCLGINLAYCELYLGLARIFRRFELTLNKTTKEDLEWSDHFVPYIAGRHLHAFVKRRDS